MLQFGPLPGRVEHQPDEPAYALLIRTLELNGSRSMIGKTLDRVTGDRDRALSQLNPAEVARICKADAHAVEYATPVLGSTTARLMGQTLSAEHVTFRKRRWCPKCLAEHAYHRVWWDIPPVTSCPDHGIELTASCGCKGRSLNWRSSPLRSCRNGHLLEDIVCNEAHPDVLALDTYVVGRLRGDGKSEPLLDGLTLGEVLTICERLGKASRNEDARIFEVRRDYDAGLLHAEGCRILLGLPGSLDELLERIRVGSQKRSGKATLRETYGYLYKFVRSLPEHAAGDALKAALAAHALRHLPVKAGTRLDGRTSHVTDTIASTVAADALGMRHERFMDLLARLGIRGEKRSQSYDVALSDFEALQTRLKGSMTLKQVSVCLGLTTLEVAELALAGKIDVVASGQGIAGWIFPANAVPDLLDGLRAIAGEPDSDPTELASMLIAAGRLGASVSEVLTLVLARAVAVTECASDRQGIHPFQVDPESLARLLPDRANAGVTFTVAARELGLTMSAMEAVMAASLLETRVVDGSVRVPVSELARFRQTWAQMPELRTAMGVATWLPVSTTLAAAGVRSPLAECRLRDRIFPRDAAMVACARAAGTGVETQETGVERGALGEALGLHTVMIRQLIEAGLISMREGCRFGSVSREEVERFRDAYVSLAALTEDFGYASARKVLSDLGEADVVAVCSKPAFFTYLFPRREAFEALRNKAQTDKSAALDQLPDQPTVLIAEAAERLGTGKHMTQQLVAHGLLPAQRKGGRFLVPVAGIDGFMRKYVLANEVGRLVGRTKDGGVGGAVTRVLINQGVRPVCARPEFVNYVFDREEIMTAIKRLDL
ncbi:hypothetical protein FV218_11055 [Methylobacterium sp. WL69]|uniref:TniQ family protein n=1 Tax=Methylobacterium sp. WL69 TaxID=2603893 RepID=UPI0011CB7368|nr:TniQ family protein [Methylobacterium sp. WL69]TXM73745.1 hypothetical protein FV218_11055 [Methylobacterium sp. WL69]